MWQGSRWSCWILCLLGCLLRNGRILSAILLVSRQIRGRMSFMYLRLCSGRRYLYLSAWLKLPTMQALSQHSARVSTTTMNTPSKKSSLLTSHPKNHHLNSNQTSAACQPTLLLSKILQDIETKLTAPAALTLLSFLFGCLSCIFRIYLFLINGNRNC